MKIVYEFDPVDDSEMFKIFQNAQNLYSAMWDFSQDILRQMDKYEQHPSGRKLNDDEVAIVEYIRDRFYQLLTEYDARLV